MDEIVKTLFEALLIVIIVVFVFLQGWRATLIPLWPCPSRSSARSRSFRSSASRSTRSRSSASCSPSASWSMTPSSSSRLWSITSRTDWRQRTPRSRPWRGVLAGHRHRAHPHGRVRADDLHSRHHRPALPAVRHHDRGSPSFSRPSTRSRSARRSPRCC